MTYGKVLTFFKKLQDENPPITDKLVKNGFKQVCDGYILEASQRGIENPSQHWHLKTYCEAKIKEGKLNHNYRYTPCGELLVYMAEASKAVDAVTLEGLVEEIITSDQIHNRRFWNNRIKDVCWDKIKLKFNQK